LLKTPSIIPLVACCSSPGCRVRCRSGWYRRRVGTALAVMVGKARVKLWVAPLRPPSSGPDVRLNEVAAGGAGAGPFGRHSPTKLRASSK